MTSPQETAAPRKGLRVIAISALGLVAGGWASLLFAFDSRMQRVEEVPVMTQQELASLRQDLVRVSGRIEASMRELNDLRQGHVQTAQIDKRLGEVERDLVDATRDLSDHAQLISQWEDFQEQVGPRALDERMKNFAEEVKTHWNSVNEVAKSAIDIAEATNANLDQVRRNLRRDPDRMWRELVGPTVQLMGDSTVGSGVLLESEPAEVPGTYTTHLVTAWHVIRDIQAGDRAAPVPVTIYGQDGRIWHETASLLVNNAEIDAALLRMDSTRKIDCGARLASRERILDARIFEQVYAVGCPLGNDPIPTFGEIADTHHIVEDEMYWMISAPTYIGNSGGGIFDAENHTLMGIFSKIYTHGALRPTVVPHMGLVTPLSAIYDWLETTGYAELIPSGESLSEDTVLLSPR